MMVSAALHQLLSVCRSTLMFHCFKFQGHTAVGHGTRFGTVKTQRDFLNMSSLTSCLTHVIPATQCRGGQTGFPTTAPGSGPSGPTCEQGDFPIHYEVVDCPVQSRQLSEQNSSLLKMLAQCEDENLQLSLEITELQTKLLRIKSDEISEHLHSKCPEKDRPFPFRQQEQAALRQQLPKEYVSFYLFLLLWHHRSVWEEKGEKDKKKQRACEKEQKQSQTGSQSQTQEAKTVGKLKGEEAGNCREQAKVLQEHLKTQAKLLHTEDVISDMKKKVCHLQASMKSGQDCADQKHTSQVPHFHTGHEKERQEAGTTVDKVVRDQADVAVVAEPEKISASEPKQTEQQSTAGGLLVTLKRIEAMVSSALGTAELVKQSERRVSQVREKMESITQKVEKALGRAANTDELLKISEERPSQVSISVQLILKQAQYPS
ncbi:hypothetical protein GOODEAATRI_004305 [Goodea atripinnis]|uniref:Uncharacterized protein n=1 Tax=Goodea atripinnis TaxID=208336 RepID=A0ABV0PBD5_9TELE